MCSAKAGDLNSQESLVRSLWPHRNSVRDARGCLVERREDATSLSGGSSNRTMRHDRCVSDGVDPCEYWPAGIAAALLRTACVLHRMAARLRRTASMRWRRRAGHVPRKCGRRDGEQQNCHQRDPAIRVEHGEILSSQPRYFTSFPMRVVVQFPDSRRHAHDTLGKHSYH